jgi:hypothetical protein
VDIVPNASNTLSLGSVTRQWNTVYARNLTIAGDTEFNNLTVDGNLTVQGNTIQIGNIVTDTKTIQLANTASTANAANGSGITVGANDNIATMLYSSTSNTWVMNIGANVTGNVTAPYFIGNGALLTGITSYSNANVVTLLAGFGSNTISTTGNITGGYIFGNGSQLTGLPAGYANANAVSYGESGWAGNIIPSGNAVYSLGNATNQWNDLYVSNTTIFMNNVPITLGAGNVLTVNGNAVLQNNSNSTISTTGNITSGNVLTGGIVSATGNVSGNYFIGNGSQLTGISSASTGNVTFNNQAVVGTGDQVGSSGLYLAPGTQSVGNLQYIRVRGGDVATHIHLDTGNNAYFDQYFGDDGKYVKLEAAGNIVINTNDGVGNSAQWTFNNFGRLTLPGGSQIRPLGANLDIIAGTGAYVNLTTSDESSSVGVDNGGGYIATAGGQWLFSTTGNLTAPGNISAVGNIVGGNLTVGSGTITGGNVNGANFNGNVAFGTGTVGGSGNITGGNILTAGIVSATGNVSGNFFIGNGSQLTGIAASYGNANVATFLAAYGSNTITTTGNITAGNLIGNISITGNVQGTSANVTLVAGAYSTVFDNTGTMTLPGGSRLRPLGANLDIFAGTGSYVNLITSDESSYMGVDSTGGFITTAGGTWGFSTTGNLTAPGNISAVGNISGGNLSLSGNITSDIGFTGATITINNAPGGNEGAEIRWALPSAANTVLNTSLIQDVFQNGMRFFEGGGNSRGLYMDLGNVPNGAGTAVGYRDVPQVSFTGNATLAATDAGRHYYSTLATANTLTIANNTSVSWSVGTAISIVNRGTGNITIAQGSGVSLYLAGNATAGNRTVTTYGMATLLNVAANVWMINGTGVS